ncbi:MAG TPA: hypothetical protein DCM40_09675 [Maribacter sp.]|nr:hypothetical protein [Maribacter sp.]
MKNIVLSFILFFSTATASIAGTTVVNTGSDSGGFHAALSFINDRIQGEYVQAGNPMVAGSYFDKDNIVTMWSTEWPGNEETPRVRMDEDTIIGLQVYETVLCSREFSSMDEMKGKNIKIATWGDSPAVEKFINQMSADLGSEITIVPYDGSGATTRGYLGGDADTIFTTATKQKKVEADGTCFATSATGDLDFAFVDVILSVNASTDIVSQYRHIVHDLSSTVEWKSSFEGTETYVVNSENTDMIVEKVKSAVELNS